MANIPNSKLKCYKRKFSRGNQVLFKKNQAKKLNNYSKTQCFAESKPRFAESVSSRVRHRGAVPPKLKKGNFNQFSLNGHEKMDLHSKFRRPGVETGWRISINVLCSKIR